LADWSKGETSSRGASLA